MSLKCWIIVCFVNGTISTPQNVVCGVPQRSILGSLLFHLLDTLLSSLIPVHAGHLFTFLRKTMYLVPILFFATAVKRKTANNCIRAVDSQLRIYTIHVIPLITCSVTQVIFLFNSWRSNRVIAWISVRIPEKTTLKMLTM